ncbi:MAG: cation-transporting P-type ATPase [Planctomyces sp.]|nr:cation-transporting P-type ATPase [Planctomyces sp.]
MPNVAAGPAKIQAPWSMPTIELAQLLESSPGSGLTDSAAAERIRKYGPNLLPETTRRSPWQLLGAQFLDRMVLLLGGAAVISILVGDISDALLIAVIVCANACIGFFQEWKAEKAVDALKHLVEPVVNVVRSGHIRRVPGRELVPGDVIQLKAGDAVPADARLLLAVELETNESALTGESLAVEKSTDRVDAGTILAERQCMIYCGSAVTRGHGKAMITHTGSSTELGRIAGMLHQAESGPTPLQKRLTRLSGQMAIVVAVACLVIFAAGMLREPREDWTRQLLAEMLLTAVSLAVAAIPEGLPAIVTVTLALGSQRMARRNAIVRRLSAVEALGSVSVICTDKTGTLTQNRMTARDFLSGSPDDDSQQSKPTHGLKLAAALCNDAQIDEHGRPVGSPTEQCLLEAALLAGLNIADLRQQWRRIDERPFSSARKRMVTLHERSPGEGLILVKGAAEQVIRDVLSEGHLSADDLSITITRSELNRQQWEELSAQLGLQGKRVLAVAGRHWSNGADLSTFGKDDEQALVLLGLVGIEDPVRPEARNAIQLCHTAGIHTIMITGDQIATARSIADQTDLAGKNALALRGSELEAMSQSDLEKQAPGTSIFARVTPEHKLRIVTALQAGGHVVAMTGDGVNDAPALKQADIGISMGVVGTDVARQASEMVLADDNFATIVGAVEEGRVIYDNIRKFIAYLLSANVSEVLVLFVAILAGWPLPLVPVQILWINLVTDGLPALALGFERGERNVMKRHPRDRDPSILGGGLGQLIACMGTTMAICSLILFYIAHDPGGGESALAHARTMVFTSLAVSQLLIVLSMRSTEDSVWHRSVLTNYRLLGAVAIGSALQLIVIYVPLAQHYLRTVALTPKELLLTAVASITPCAVLEIWKLAANRTQRRLDT